MFVVDLFYVCDADSTDQIHVLRQNYTTKVIVAYNNLQCFEYKKSSTGKFG